MKALWCVVTICLSSFSSAAELVLACDLSKAPSESVALIRDGEIASTHVYYLQQGKRRTPVLGDRHRSRGSSITAECIGSVRRALVVSGEFTANALQGFVLAYFADEKKVERLDFAEKRRPAWIYLGSREMRIVIDTQGLGESDAKYVIYSRTVGSTQTEAISTSNELPAPDGFEVIALPTAPSY